ncbi:SIS domain-containing protein [Streptomyces sp. NPDC002514]|uniref:SIS domain-containing protein n=1 Tax=Streptomyces sp. NPDC001270 TaxID=3364554 RepID=UPI003696D56C
MRTDETRAVINAGREVVRREAAALTALATRIDDSFAHAVRRVESCRGRVVTSGIGKSGLVAARQASLLSTIGIPAFHVHAGDALHGDAGAITSDDVLMAVSYSGETTEVCNLAGIVQARGVPVIAITGAPLSELAAKADIVLELPACTEADSLGLVPSCSSASATGIADALAIVLMSRRGMKPREFGVNHPNGKLGRTARGV